jgi:prepilin-type N-terminal cleavage/methylation domain-containing protein
MKNNKISKVKSGFSILELSIVVAVLSVLTSISFANVNKWVKLSRINEAKSIIDNSIVQCLQSIRDTGDLPPTISVPSNIISDTRLNILGYKIKNPSNVNCGDLSIVPVSQNETLLYEFGFTITNNNVNKIAYPAGDQSSLGSCEAWAGDNCGVSEAQLAIWAAEAALAESRNDCLNTYNAWLAGPPPATGPYQTWNSSANECNQPIFAFEGNLVADQAAIDAALANQRNANCNQKVNEYKTQNPPISGAIPISECQGPNESSAPIYYFCLGNEVQSQADMDVCLSNNEVAQCNAARIQARGEPGIGNHTGPFQASQNGPIECTKTTWMCKGAEYDSQQDYDDDERCTNTSLYPCNSGYPAQSPQQQCCAPYGMFSSSCSIRCGEGGSEPDNAFCNTFNECSCYGQDP